MENKDIKDKTNETAAAQTTSNVKAAESTPQLAVYSVKKTVEIRRKQMTTILPEEGVFTADQYNIRLGGAYKANTSMPLGRTIFKDSDEEKRLMTQIIEVSPTSAEWDKTLNDYWHNFSVNIPYNGRSLTVSHEVRDGIVYPENVADYVLWLYCLAHNTVANSIEYVNRSPKILFYLFDSSEVAKAGVALRKLKDEATIERVKIQNDVLLRRKVLLVLGSSIPVSEDEILIELSKASDSQPEKFLEVCRDKNLTDKAFITECINHKLLSRPTGSSLVIYDGAEIGKNINEAIIWLNIDTNASIKRQLESQLQSL